MATPARAISARFTASRAERTIAATRVTLAGLLLLAMWLDPAEPGRYATVSRSLYFFYIGYATVIAAIVWARMAPASLPLTTHILDLIIFSAFQYFTTGPTSPAFLYFVFAMFCAALRWSWLGTIRTFPVVLVSFILVGSPIIPQFAPPAQFELNRFVIRITYLLMVGGLLAYLGRHEMDRRTEIQQLARWPAASGTNEQAAKIFLAYAADVVGAETVVVVWSPIDEPRTSMAVWSRENWKVTSFAPGEVEPLVAPTLAVRAFICAAPLTGPTTVLVQRSRGTAAWNGAPIHRTIADALPGVTAGSSAFETDRVSGRVFFGWPEKVGADMLPLIEAVGRQVGASLEQSFTREMQHRVAIGEERVRLARDLHDGVLQSLTGVRFELQRLAQEVPDSAAGARDSMLTMERALSLEQRELRLFIESLRPLTRSGVSGSLVARLEDLRDRLTTQWKVPIDIRASEPAQRLSPAIDHAVVPMVQEAVVNALKHAQPTRVRVTVRDNGSHLTIMVDDDGTGFGFDGRRTGDQLAEANLGPASLRERTVSLGGQLAIESSVAGSRVEVSLPREGVH